MGNNIYAAMKLRKIADQNRKDKYSELSKQRLNKIIRTKTQTIFIGALNAFELVFGYLWGHGKPEYKLTDKELENREKWKSIRNQILNNGNNQYRAIENELEEYSLVWNRYHLNIPIKEQNNEE